MCISGTHDFPSEDDEGAYCPEHGVTLLFHGLPITPEDLGHVYPSRPARYELLPADGARPH
ncbi:hypothetical protein [Streptomyces niveus]|uniref:hypothetical protein n=1 Tax=Streptomyces niveus TaxID=193462 RepID=UPI00084C719D|nr:hypothetical protein [Streptomyces niveus]